MKLSPFAKVFLLVSISILHHTCSDIPSRGVGRVSFYRNNILLTQISVQSVETNEWRAQQDSVDQNSFSFSYGKLFIFPQEAIQPFRINKNHPPFDAIFVAPYNKIVVIKKNVLPYIEQVLPSGNLILYKYVIIVNSDFCDSYSIGKNDSVSFKITGKKNQYH